MRNGAKVASQRRWEEGKGGKRDVYEHVCFLIGKQMFLKVRTSILERQIARTSMQHRKEAPRRRVKQARSAQKRARSAFEHKPQF